MALRFWGGDRGKAVRGEFCCDDTDGSQIDYPTDR